MEFQHNNYLLSDRAQFFGRKTVPIRLSRQLLRLPSSIKNNYAQIVTNYNQTADYLNRRNPSTIK